MAQIYGRGVDLQFDDPENDRLNKIVTKFDADYDHSHYKERGQPFSHHNRRQNRLGKKGEYFAMKYLVEVCGFPNTVVPDIEIYPPGSKSFEPDLPYNKTFPWLPNVHVKSTDMHDEFGYSLMHQYLDKYGRGKDILFRNNRCDNDLMIYVCTLDEWCPVAMILAVWTWHDVKTAFGPELKLPILDRLKKFKRTVYDSDIRDLVASTNMYIPRAITYQQPVMQVLPMPPTIPTTPAIQALP